MAFVFDEQDDSVRATLPQQTSSILEVLHQDDGYARFAGWTAEGPTLDERLARCRPGWFDRAACRGCDPELFFPATGDSGAEAKAVCATCEVRAPCAQLAADRSERYGIWGGLGTAQRRAQLRAG